MKKTVQVTDYLKAMYFFFKKKYIRLYIEIPNYGFFLPGWAREKVIIHGIYIWI